MWGRNLYCWGQETKGAVGRSLHGWVCLAFFNEAAVFVKWFFNVELLSTVTKGNARVNDSPSVASSVKDAGFSRQKNIQDSKCKWPLWRQERYALAETGAQHCGVS